MLCQCAVTIHTYWWLWPKLGCPIFLSQTGVGVILCIEKALAQSGVSKEDVNYINAHATSTPAGDLKEYQALLHCFGQNPEVSFLSDVTNLLTLAFLFTKSNLALFLSFFFGCINLCSCLLFLWHTNKDPLFSSKWILQNPWLVIY